MAETPPVLAGTFEFELDMVVGLKRFCDWFIRLLELVKVII